MNQRSEIGDCSRQDIVGVKTLMEETPNPDIEPGIRHFANVGFWGFLICERLTPKFLNYDSGCVTVGHRGNNVAHLELTHLIIPSGIRLNDIPYLNNHDL